MEKKKKIRRSQQIRQQSGGLDFIEASTPFEATVCRVNCVQGEKLGSSGDQMGKQ